MSSKKNLIHCSKCDISTCRECVKAYLLSSSQKAHCSKCKMEWSEKKLHTSCTKSWSEGIYRNHLKNILLEIEKLKIPQAIDEYEKQKQRKKLELELQTRRKNKRTVLAEIKKLKTSIKNIQDIEETNTIRLQIQDLYQIYYDDANFIRNAQNNMAAIYNKKKVQNATYICHCPKDGCLGLVRSDDNTCKICDTLICTRCYCLKEDKHVCKKDDVETTKILKLETKPCPKCSIAIYKISGCSQMFCTYCKTVFDWNTLKIDTGIVHNPHAVEWRSMNRKILADAANENNNCQPDMREIWEFIDFTDDIFREIYIVDGFYHNKIKEMCDMITNFIRNVHRIVSEHMRFNRIDRNDILLISYEQKALENGIEYISNQIDEDTWKRRIFLNERNYNRNVAEMNIYKTYLEISRDIFNIFFSDIRSPEVPRDCVISEKNIDYMKIKVTEKELKLILENNNIGKLNNILKFREEMLSAREYINNILKDELKILGKTKIRLIEEYE